MVVTISISDDIGPYHDGQIVSLDDVTNKVLLRALFNGGFAELISPIDWVPPPEWTPLDVPVITDFLLSSTVSFTPFGSVSAINVQSAIEELDTEKSGTSHVHSGASVCIALSLSDETTAITTGDAKLTFRMPHAMTLTAVRASLSTASSSGIPTVDINEGGSTILSTKLTIDVSEKTSTTAAVPAVISDSTLADDAEIIFDIDVAGTGAKGLKVYLIGARP